MTQAYYEAYGRANTKHLSQYISKIDFVALQDTACGLRNGVKCLLPALANGKADYEALTSQMGGQNLHVDLVFEDGVTWIARLRLEGPFVPPKLTRDAIVKSEVATLNFLAKTTVPVSRVHSYTLSSSLDRVGVPYMFMDKLPGAPLYYDKLDNVQKSRFLSQLAEIFIELSRYPFRQSGSLIMDCTQDLAIGSSAQVNLFTDPEHAHGPFTSMNAAAKDICNFYLDMYVSRELDTFPIDGFVITSHLLSLVDTLYPVTQTPNFFLKHNDDKGDHILVDSEGNITGLIDWEYASTESKELAFSSPCMMWDVGDFYDGSNELTPVEKEFSELLSQKGYDGLAQIVSNGRLHQRFWFSLCCAPQSRAELIDLFDGFRMAYSTSQGGTSIESYEEWQKRTVQELMTTDPRLQRILQRERAKEYNANSQ